MRSARGLPWTWGSREGIEAPDPRDGGPDGRLASRAVATDASPEALFLWLCQLRRAPYSYDWIDNIGRRSPRSPDLSLTDLEVGQRVMTIFTLAAFVPDHSLTITMRSGVPTRVFGDITVRYAIVPTTEGHLLRGDLWMPQQGRASRLRRSLLAWGDLVMMRKQLRTLRTLAETTGEQSHTP